MSTESSGGELESRTTEGVTSRVRMGTVGRGGREWGSSWTGGGEYACARGGAVEGSLRRGSNGVTGVGDDGG
jgi:hypothetical protein